MEDFAVHRRSNGAVEDFESSPEGVAAAFDSAPPSGRAVVMVSDGFTIVQAKRKDDGRWRVRAVEVSGGAHGGARQRKSAPVETAAARTAMVALAAGSPTWDAQLTFKLGFGSRSPALLIPLTFAVATVGGMIYLQLSGNLEDFEWKYVPNLVVGVAMISGIVVYISWFMGSVRPAIARRMARWFGVQGIEESDLEANYAWFSRPGWWVAPGSGFVLSAKVAIADFVVLIFGVVLPVAAIATGVVLASSRFLA